MRMKIVLFIFFVFPFIWSCTEIERDNVNDPYGENPISVSKKQISGRCDGDIGDVSKIVAVVSAEGLQSKLNSELGYMSGTGEYNGSISIPDEYDYCNVAISVYDDETHVIGYVEDEYSTNFAEMIVPLFDCKNAIPTIKWKSCIYYILSEEIHINVGFEDNYGVIENASYSFDGNTFIDLNLKNNTADTNFSYAGDILSEITILFKDNDGNEIEQNVDVMSINLYSDNTGLSEDSEVFEVNESYFDTSREIYVEGGSYTYPESDYYDNSQTTVAVESFYISKYELTQNEWSKIHVDYPYGMQETGLNHPICCNWYEAIEFCNAKSIAEDLTPCYSINGSTNPDDWGITPIDSWNIAEWDSVKCDFDSDGYRLPTLAEWEYAANGGNKSEGYIYSGSNDFVEVGWYNSSYKENHEVAEKESNELGLYDMSGNVPEWCWNWFENTVAIDITDGYRLEMGEQYSDGSGGRIDTRGWGSPGITYARVGLRLVRSNK